MSQYIIYILLLHLLYQGNLIMTAETVAPRQFITGNFTIEILTLKQEIPNNLTCISSFREPNKDPNLGLGVYDSRSESLNVWLDAN